MKIKLLAINILLLCFVSLQAKKSEVDSLLSILKYEIKNKETYMLMKEERIRGLKQMLKLPSLTNEQQYEINRKLYNEYYKYKADSAMVYEEKNLQLGLVTRLQDHIDEAKLNLAQLYSTTGLYIESLNLLNSIDKKKLSRKLMPHYFYSYSLFYNHYAQSNNRYSYYNENNSYKNLLLDTLYANANQKEFYRQYANNHTAYSGYAESNAYKDSMLYYLDKNSHRYIISLSEKEIYESGNADAAEKLLLPLFNDLTHEDAEYAMVTYLLGSVYKQKMDVIRQKKYFTLSAIADVRNAIKDNASLQSLALLLYEAGEINLAYECIQSSVEDAIFCNVRYRTIESSNSYPIITGTYQQKEKKQKTELETYLFLISLLAVVVVIALIYIYNQVKRLAKIKRTLYYANQELNGLNNNLLNTNEHLDESNKIKENYIAYSFDLCSNYIKKIEDFNNLLYKKVQLRKFDEIAKILSSHDIVSNELKEFYNNFDNMFLGIYPTFVDDFNKLLLPEEQIKLKSGESLTPELRIFALIRLGINDSSRIANYLHYSLSTIYNYRTKMRNKAAVPRDEFENYVMRIATNSSK